MKFTSNSTALMRVGNHWINPNETLVNPYLTLKEYKALKKLAATGKVSIEDNGVGPLGVNDDMYETMSTMVFMTEE